MTRTRYTGRCHCDAIRFAFWSEPILSGLRCNCSLCVRKGIVMSTRYIEQADFELLAGDAAFAVYRFGDRSVDHAFCRVCGVAPFTEVVAVPAGYAGPARPGDRRINLGCVDGLDALTLPIDLVDGR